MKFMGPLFVVEDIEVSKKFYTEVLGQEIIMDLGINVTFQGGFSLQQDFARLVGFDPNSILKKAHNAEFYFEEKHFDDFVQTVKSTEGISLFHDVKEHSWGQRSIYLYDPNGHLIEVGESMGSVVKRYLNRGLSVEETAVKMDCPVEFVKQYL